MTIELEPALMAGRYIARVRFNAGAAAGDVAGFRAVLNAPPGVQLVGMAEDTRTGTAVLNIRGRDVNAAGVAAQGTTAGDLFALEVAVGDPSLLDGLALSVNELVDTRGRDRRSAMVQPARPIWRR